MLGTEEARPRVQHWTEPANLSVPRQSNAFRLFVFLIALTIFGIVAGYTSQHNMRAMILINRMPPSNNTPATGRGGTPEEIR